MIRRGIYKPTIEDCIEMSGIETLHPGGFALTKRTAELADLKPGKTVLDVSSGRGTQSVFYAQEFGVTIVGLDLSQEMLDASEKKVAEACLSQLVSFKKGDSQALPFEDNTFDVVINECAVGIPDDSQKVLDEMIRVLKPGGSIVIHESTWRQKLNDAEKQEVSERYGTTPLEYDEWVTMLKKAGTENIITEFDEWSKPEMFWKVRKDKDVTHYSKVMSFAEKIRLYLRIFSKFGFTGLFKAFKNEKIFFKTVLDGKLGYCLFKGTKGL